MLRYFIVSVVVAAVAYIAMRFTIGTHILTDLSAEEAQHQIYMIPGLIAAFLSCWFLRPLVRAHTLIGPTLATILYPFFVGCGFAAILFSRAFTPGMQSTFADQMGGMLHAVFDAPLYVLGTLPVAFPVAGLAMFALRKSDPGEAMTDKRERATAGPFKL